MGDGAAGTAASCAATSPGTDCTGSAGMTTATAAGTASGIGAAGVGTSGRTSAITPPSATRHNSTAPTRRSTAGRRRRGGRASLVGSSAGRRSRRGTRCSTNKARFAAPTQASPPGRRKGGCASKVSSSSAGRNNICRGVSRRWTTGSSPAKISGKHAASSLLRTASSASGVSKGRKSSTATPRAGWIRTVGELPLSPGRSRQSRRMIHSCPSSSKSMMEKPAVPGDGGNSARTACCAMGILSIGQTAHRARSRRARPPSSSGAGPERCDYGCNRCRILGPITSCIYTLEEDSQRRAQNGSPRGHRDLRTEAALGSGAASAPPRRSAKSP